MSLRLGTDTGSVVNHLRSRATIGQPAPVVGMGVTMLSWTDRHAGTIFRVFTKGRFTYIEVRADREVCTHYNYEEQDYDFKVNPKGAKSYFRAVLPDGAWEAVYVNPDTGRFVKSRSGRGLHIGVRDSYRDPCF